MIDIRQAFMVLFLAIGHHFFAEGISKSRIPSVDIPIANRSEPAIRKALVTGSCGFISGFVIKFLSMELGFDVVGIDNRGCSPSSISKSHLHLSQKQQSIVHLAGDLQNVSFLKDLFLSHGPFDYIYHIPSNGARDSYMSQLDLLTGDSNLLNHAVTQKPIVKALVFVSSISAIYGSKGRAVSEISNKLPDSISEVSLCAFERSLELSKNIFGLNYLILRYHSVFGPGQPSAFDTFSNSVALFLTQIMKNESVVVLGNGDQQVSYSFVADIARMIGSSVLHSSTFNTDYFIGNDKQITENELISSIYDTLGRMNERRKVIHLVQGRIGSGASISISFEKYAGAFNPPPATDLSKALNMTAHYISSIHSHSHRNVIRPLKTTNIINQRPSFSKHRTRVIIFIPTPISSSKRRIPLHKQFLREDWQNSEVILFFVVGSKTGPRVELDIDLSPLSKEPQMDFLVTNCRDDGDEINNANGTSSTTCKVYEAMKYIYFNYEADYVWRGADDAYLNIRKFLLSIAPSLPATSWWLGKLRTIGESPHFDKDLLYEKQPQLHKLFNLYRPAHYMFGMGFAFSWDVVALVASWAIPPHQTYAEDVILGLWFNPFQIKKIHRPDLINNIDQIRNYTGSSNVDAVLLHYIRPVDWTLINDNGILTKIMPMEGETTGK